MVSLTAGLASLLQEHLPCRVTSHVNCGCLQQCILMSLSTVGQSLLSKWCHTCDCQPDKLLHHHQCGRGDQSLPNKEATGSNNPLNASFTKEKIMSFCSLCCQGCSCNLPTPIIFFEQGTVLIARRHGRDHTPAKRFSCDAPICTSSVESPLQFIVTMQD